MAPRRSVLSLGSVSSSWAQRRSWRDRFPEDNSHGLPLSDEMMGFRTSHRGTSLPIVAIARLVRDGEVPFIH
jgi:hypothetical protein